MILLAYLDNNMNLKKIPFTLLAMGAFAPVYADSFRIEEMRIEGEQHTSEDTIRALMSVKEGDMYTDEIGEKIVRDLHASGFYETKRQYAYCYRERTPNHQRCNHQRF